jgi:hypothetical protein
LLPSYRPIVLLSYRVIVPPPFLPASLPSFLPSPATLLFCPSSLIRFLPFFPSCHFPCH